MEKQFKTFYHLLEREKCFDTIEFRLRFQKKLYKYVEAPSFILEEELLIIMKNYMLIKDQNI